jgi:hypothetical protein
MNTNINEVQRLWFLKLDNVYECLAWSLREMMPLVMLIIFSFFAIPAKSQAREPTVTEAVCEDLATFVYWRSTELVSKADKNEAKKALDELRQPGYIRPRISESQICEADFIAGTSHGNSGNGSKMILARGDAILVSLRTQRSCNANNGRLPTQAPWLCNK